MTYSKQQQNTTEGEDNVVRLPIDVDIQYHLLHMMLVSESFLVKMAFHLEDRYFENNILGWFFSVIKEYYENFKKIPELATIKNEILKFLPADRPKYQRVFERVEASTYTDEEYLLQELTAWLQSRKFVSLHAEMAELYNSNRRDSAYEMTSQAILELKELDLTQDKTINFDDIYKIIERASSMNVSRIPTGIPDIDRAMLGGLPKQTLTTILGSTNVGKTVMLINMAYNAMLFNKKVLFIYLEGQNDQLTFRFLSRQTGIPYMKFYNGISPLNEDDNKAINRSRQVFRDRLVLKPWQRFGVTIEEIVSYCRKKKSEFNYDLMVLDYGQLLVTKTLANEVRHNQAAVYRGLSQLAAELDVAVVTAAQGNRMAHVDVENGKRLMSMTDIAECFEICRCSECVITLTRSKEDQVNNKVKILLAKQRDGLVNVAVDCVTNLNVLTMYDRNLGIESLRLNDKCEIVGDEHSGSTLVENNLNG